MLRVVTALALLFPFLWHDLTALMVSPVAAVIVLGSGYVTLLSQVPTLKNARPRARSNGGL